MMKLFTKFAAMALLLALYGCQGDQPEEPTMNGDEMVDEMKQGAKKAGEATGKAMEDTGEAIQDAADETGDAMEDAMDEGEDAMDEMADEAEEAADDMDDEMN